MVYDIMSLGDFMNSETLRYIEAFIEELKEHTSYKKLIKLHKEMKNNEEINRLIKHFKETEKAYQEASKYGKYYPDYASIKRSFIESKTTLYTHPVVKEYKRAERDFEDVLDDSAFSISNSISKRITVQTRVPIYRSKGGSLCSVDKA